MTPPSTIDPERATAREWTGAPLRAWDRARTLAQMARWAVSLVRHDTRHPSPVPRNPKFMAARHAVKLIRDGDVVAVSGLGATQRASILYWAIREAFEESGHPGHLTVVNLGGGGGRGKVPGTLEELGRPGLCTRLITSHFETFHAMLDLAAKGQCELQCIPFGVLSRLVEAFGRGKHSWVTATGVGTCMDPRVGGGSRVAGGTGEQLIRAEGDRLRYRIPAIDVALFNAPAADRQGNLYVDRCASIGDSREIALAAKRNGGCVIANVGLVVDKGYGDVFLPADLVDAVVYYPETEQTGGVFHRDPWPVLTTEGDPSTLGEALERIRFLNWLAGITARRTTADEVVARLAAATLLANVPRGGTVDIGVGLGEDVCRVLFEAGKLDDVTLLAESGVIGGLPAPGLFFGAALCPRRIVSPAEIFTLCEEKLDGTCLGVLQADSEGNVNVSKRGEGPWGYVGPGGFIDLTTAAQTIIFVSAWRARAKVEVDGGKLRFVTRGTPKFVERVDEITFNGPRALDAGKRVFYATHVGLFHLTRRGMELVQVMPGIDVRKDIVEQTEMKVVLPRSGRVPLVPRSIVTGEGFAPSVGRRRAAVRASEGKRKAG